MKHSWIITGWFAVMPGVSIAASDIDQLQNISQSQFRLLSEDLGAALSYKALTPAEPLGIAGFDMSVDLTVTYLQHAEVLEQATRGDALTILPVPRLHIQKGLPLDFDIGASYSEVPATNIKLWGIEARWAILKGGVATPALSLRGSHTKLNGVDQLNLATNSVDLSVSKGFAFVTPYIGVGEVWTMSSPKNVPGLVEEKFSMSKIFAGINFKATLFNMAAEVDRTGDAMSYGARLGIRF